MMAYIQLICIGILLINSAVCLENLAQDMNYRGFASNSFPFGENHWAPENAVDGNFELYNESFCSFTQSWKTKMAWWKFTLLHFSNVAYLQIFFRKNTVNRHAGFSVFVFNDSSYVPPSPNGTKVFTLDPSFCPNHVMNVTVNKVTKGIAIFNSKDPPLNTSCEGYKPAFATIEVCEVMVMGCESRHFGNQCKLCSANCLNRDCDAFNGSCIYGCSIRFSNPPDCSVCKNGFFGPYCEHVCGKCKIRTFCNNITGICPNGCRSRWSGSNCDVCNAGYFGHNCEHTCGYCTNGTSCHNITGICPGGCQSRWSGSKCDMCKNGFYGNNCINICGRCKYGLYCHNLTGICQEGCENHWNGSKCNVCEKGFYGTNCDNNCGNCANMTTCNNLTGTCTDGCQGRWNGSKCDVCESGFYGSKCNEKCGYCIQNICTQTDGHCLSGCQGNWIGVRCDVCKNGYYGRNCEHVCGKCKIGTYCNNITGICPDGCQSRWSGSNCDVCENGFYDHNCSKKCGHCKHGTTCNNLTGICQEGCDNHWIGSKCNECQDYKYGPNCVFDCGHCKNGKPCTKLNGVCADKCEAGWSGLFCLKILSSTGDLYAGDGISRTSSVIIAIVSTLFLVTLLCVGMGSFLKKRKRVNKHDKQDQVDSIPSNSFHNPTCYNELVDSYEDNTYHELDSSS